MGAKISKEAYIRMVKFVLQSMLELAKTEKTYNLFYDTVHYYENAIAKENVLTYDEFIELCKEVYGKEKIAL